MRCDRLRHRRDCVEERGHEEPERARDQPVSCDQRDETRGVVGRADCTIRKTSEKTMPASAMVPDGSPSRSRWPQGRHRGDEARKRVQFEARHVNPAVNAAAAYNAGMPRTSSGVSARPSFPSFLGVPGSQNATANANPGPPVTPLYPVFPLLGTVAARPPAVVGAANTSSEKLRTPSVARRRQHGVVSTAGGCQMTAYVADERARYQIRVDGRLEGLWARGWVRWRWTSTPTAATP